MPSSNEILNIEYNIRQMLIQALNKYDRKTAAQKLGICTRTLDRYKNSFNIVKTPSGEFLIKQKINHEHQQPHY